MSTARAMKKQNELLREEGKREGMVEGNRDGFIRGRLAKRLRVLAYLERRILAATLAATKLVLQNLKADLEADEDERDDPAVP